MTKAEKELLEKVSQAVREFLAKNRRKALDGYTEEQEIIRKDVMDHFAGARVDFTEVYEYVTSKHDRFMTKKMLGLILKDVKKARVGIRKNTYYIFCT